MINLLRERADKAEAAATQLQERVRVLEENQLKIDTAYVELRANFMHHVVDAQPPRIPRFTDVERAAIAKGADRLRKANWFNHTMYREQQDAADTLQKMLA